MIAGGSETPDLAVSSISLILHHLCSIHEEDDNWNVVHASDSVSKNYEHTAVYSIAVALFSSYLSTMW